LHFKNEGLKQAISEFDNELESEVHVVTLVFGRKKLLCLARATIRDSI